MARNAHSVRGGRVTRNPAPRRSSRITKSCSARLAATLTTIDSTSDDSNTVGSITVQQNQTTTSASLDILATVADLFYQRDYPIEATAMGSYTTREIEVARSMLELAGTSLTDNESLPTASADLLASCSGEIDEDQTVDSPGRTISISPSSEDEQSDRTDDASILESQEPARSDQSQRGRIMLRFPNPRYCAATTRSPKSGRGRIMLRLRRPRSS